MVLGEGAGAPVNIGEGSRAVKPAGGVRGLAFAPLQPLDREMESKDGRVEVASQLIVERPRDRDARQELQRVADVLLGGFAAAQLGADASVARLAARRLGASLLRWDEGQAPALAGAALFVGATLR